MGLVIERPALIRTPKRMQSDQQTATRYRYSVSELGRVESITFYCLTAAKGTKPTWLDAI
jgi:hypothetical protein